MPSRTEGLTLASVLEGFGHRKNARTALEAFAKFRLRHPQSRYVMFGGDYQEGGPAHVWAHHRGLDAGVEFRGYTPQAVFHPFLSEQTDILLHPALLESHPLAITEAMALGVPVLGGQASGGVPWTLDEGRAGALTDVRDAEQMARSLEELALHPAKRSHLARAGWEHAHRYFREETMVDAYLRAYQEVLTQTALAANPSTVASG
jgi:glycosyltransferase involved in cell wall biosynthesis